MHCNRRVVVVKYVITSLILRHGSVMVRIECMACVTAQPHRLRCADGGMMNYRKLAHNNENEQLL